MAGDIQRNQAFSIPLLGLNAVALDTETTGLDSRKARILQIGAVRVSDGAVRAADRFETLVNPGGPIPKSSIAIHGITDQAVAAEPAFPNVIEPMEAFIRRSMVIGHSLPYDFAVLQNEYALAKRVWPGFHGLDVRDLARIVAPTLADYGLERLCEWLGVEIEGRHTAIGDAVAAANVFVALIPLLRERNIRTVAEAEAGCRAQAKEMALKTGVFTVSLPMAPSETRTLARIDSYPYRHRVRDVMSAPPIFVSPETTVRDAVDILLQKRVSSVFLRSPSGEVGIVTERDVLRAVAEDRLGGPLSVIMKAPLQTVEKDAFIYRAIGRMERLGFRHLGVRDDRGEIVGAVTPRNLLRHRAMAAIILGDAIDAAVSPAALCKAWASLPMMASSLMAEEVDARLISEVISSEICIMTRRAAELAEERMRSEGQGPPPVPYCVMVLGSAARGESQLAADQDNAIVYAEGEENGVEDRFFQTMASHMNAILDESGIPNCKGGVMARNRPWRKSVADWRMTIDGWVRRQRPKDLLNVDIFFDAVPVHGDYALADGIWNYAYEAGNAARDFQNLLIEMTRQPENAFTTFGNFKLNSSGRIDLKKYGLMPIFASARVLSIRHDVRARSTPARLNGAMEKGVGSPSIVKDILDAHRVILRAIIEQQLIDAKAGAPLSTFVGAARLDRPRRLELKQALAAVEEATGLVSEGRL